MALAVLLFVALMSLGSAQFAVDDAATFEQDVHEYVQALQSACLPETYRCRRTRLRVGRQSTLDCLAQCEDDTSEAFECVARRKTQAACRGRATCAARCGVRIYHNTFLH